VALTAPNPWYADVLGAGCYSAYIVPRRAGRCGSAWLCAGPPTNVATLLSAWRTTSIGVVERSGKIHTVVHVAALKPIPEVFA
jgi:hypothetical protein